jgi:glycosyltransferase involved in cell wall biosynthesis
MLEKKANFSIVIPTLMLDISRLIDLLNTLRVIINENEVIVVFQGEQLEAYNQLLGKYSDVEEFRFFKSESVGISVARNMGIQNSKNDWIVLLDDDVSVQPSFVSSLESCIHPNDLFYYGNVYIEGSLDRYVNLYIQGRSLSYFSYNRVCSIALVFNKNIIKIIGDFDPRIGAGQYYGSCEESDFILRALNNKIQIKYLKSHDVWHPKVAFPLKKFFSYGVGLGAMYKKHFKNAPTKLKIKFIGDILIRILLLVTMKPKRYVFLLGFLDGLVKFK